MVSCLESSNAPPSPTEYVRCLSCTPRKREKLPTPLCCYTPLCFYIPILTMLVINTSDSRLGVVRFCLSLVWFHSVLFPLFMTSTDIICICWLRAECHKFSTRLLPTWKRKKNYYAFARSPDSKITNQRIIGFNITRLQTNSFASSPHSHAKSCQPHLETKC